jgi:hypothetical protein
MIKLKIPVDWCERFVDPKSLTLQPKILYPSYQLLVESFNGKFIIEYERRRITIRMSRYYDYEICTPVPYVIFATEADAVLFKLQHL